MKTTVTMNGYVYRHTKRFPVVEKFPDLLKIITATV
jgi:hypothetical protein